MANLYFDDLQNDSYSVTRKQRYYFRLVRSYTPPGQAISVIATRRPYDSPFISKNQSNFYYRLQPVESTILSKTHMPYALGTKRMARWVELFYMPEYKVSKLPSYKPKEASNPFTTFQAIPVKSRYQFMLDEAQFTIMGFIKGPVCRGQVALNVINDHFWVFFQNPDDPTAKDTADFLARESDHLHLPAEAQSTLQPLRYWLDYSKQQKNYLKAKYQYMNKVFEKSNKIGLNIVWNGEGQNPNAALTVFRHFDSASVVQGMVGQPPKTAWLIGYPLLERIHYLLVAGFDVYGNFGHQLLSRLYMDFLRMEGEFNFITLLPNGEKQKLWQHWYRDADSEVKNYVEQASRDFYHNADISYVDSGLATKQTLYIKLQDHLAKNLSNKFNINHSSVPDNHRRALINLQSIKGEGLSVFPEVANLMVVGEGKEPASISRSAKTLYTIIHNSAHSNISSLFREDSNRLPEEDSLTIVPGILGAYPNVFLIVKEMELAAFVEKVSILRTDKDYDKLLDVYGVRRTADNFWRHSDEVHQAYKKIEPRQYGLLDYSRLENR